MATSKVIEEMIAECFPAEYVAVVTGGRKENAALLSQDFDFIFFTGSQMVGKEVLRHAAERLIPVVLELGGKSPCIVEAGADLKLAARRIVFGKFLNCGQTCVAPDHILCEMSIKDDLIKEIVAQIEKQFGHSPLDHADYGKIINKKHFDRLCGLLDRRKVVYGGQTNEVSCQIGPTVMDGVTYEDKVMKEEIFGPILPVLTFERFDDLIDDLKEKDEPLALYIFSSNKEHIARVNKELCYGGGCINDVVIHLASSGMGTYHGQAGFDAFSHYKSIVDKKTWIDLPMRYRPYNNKLYEKLLHVFLR